MVRKILCTMTALGMFVAACGDDKGVTETDPTSPNTSTGNESSSGGGPTTDPPTSTTTVEPTTTTVDPSTTSTDPSTTTTTTDPDTTNGPTNPSSSTDPDTTDPSTTGLTPEEQCKMMVDPPDDPCGNCACENCLEELQACNEDEGCKAIRECAQETGCTDAPSCFDLCGDVIMMHFGSVGLAMTIADCIAAECQAECAG